jgi:hypothetical protein
MGHEADAGQPANANTLVGDMSGISVQAKDIHGNVTINTAPPSLQKVTLPYRAGTVPLRARCFQDRAVATLLAQAVDTGDAAVLTSGGTSVLSGLGGVGKTQLAVDYAEQLWAAAELDLLVWITAGSRDAIVTDYARLITKLTGTPNTDPEDAAREALSWLSNTTARWLVVLDDLQSPADVRELWPPATSTGRVVVTTRRRDAALSGHQRRLINIGLFTAEESQSYLAAKLTDYPHLVDGAAALADDLGHLPVALAQAAAYVIDRGLSCVDYQRRFANRRQKLVALLPDDDGLPDEHRDTVAASWSLSIERADLLPPVGVARPLLELASLLDPNGIPGPLFTTGAVLTRLSAVTGREITPDGARDGLGCLHRLNLISLDPDSSHRAVGVHALVQRAVRDHLENDTLAATTTAAADALYEVWPDIQRDPELARVLRADIDALHASGGRYLWAPDGHVVLFRTGMSLSESGQVGAAVDYFEQLHQTATQHLGQDHPDTLATRGNLANCRGEAGDSAGAVQALEDLLTDQLRIVGPDDSDTLATRNNLAVWRGQAGDPIGALQAFVDLLTDLVRILSPDHPDTLTVRGHLANSLGEAGDPSGAVQAFEYLLADRLRVLSPDHLNTLRARSNLAGWRGRAGDLTGALEALEELLPDRLRVLGPDHPDTLRVGRKLAHWRRVVAQQT